MEKELEPTKMEKSVLLQRKTSWIARQKVRDREREREREVPPFLNFCGVRVLVGSDQTSCGHRGSGQCPDLPTGVGSARSKQASKQASKREREKERMENQKGKEFVTSNGNLGSIRTFRGNQGHEKMETLYTMGECIGATTLTCLHCLQACRLSGSGNLVDYSKPNSGSNLCLTRKQSSFNLYRQFHEASGSFRAGCQVRTHRPELRSQFEGMFSAESQGIDS